MRNGHLLALQHIRPGEQSESCTHGVLLLRQGLTAGQQQSDTRYVGGMQYPLQQSSPGGKKKYNGIECYNVYVGCVCVRCILPDSFHEYANDLPTAMHW